MKPIEAKTQGKGEGSGEGQEEPQGEVPEAVLHRAKATTKDSEIMTWDCLKDGALVATRPLSLKEDMETGVAEDIHRNRSQRTGVEATEEEIVISRHLAGVSSMAISILMAIISLLNSPKGNVIQREEQGNRIKEGVRFVEEMQLHCSRLTLPTVMG